MYSFDRWKNQIYNRSHHNGRSSANNKSTTNTNVYSNSHAAPPVRHPTPENTPTSNKWWSNIFNFFKSIRVIINGLTKRKSPPSPPNTTPLANQAEETLNTNTQSNQNLGGQKRSMVSSFSSQNHEPTNTIVEEKPPQNQQTSPLADGAINFNSQEENSSTSSSTQLDTEQHQSNQLTENLQAVGAGDSASQEQQQREQCLSVIETKMQAVSNTLNQINSCSRGIYDELLKHYFYGSTQEAYFEKIKSHSLGILEKVRDFYENAEQQCECILLIVQRINISGKDRQIEEIKSHAKGHQLLKLIRDKLWKIQEEKINEILHASPADLLKINTASAEPEVIKDVEKDFETVIKDVQWRIRHPRQKWAGKSFNQKFETLSYLYSKT